MPSSNNVCSFVSSNGVNRIEEWARRAAFGMRGAGEGKQCAGLGWAGQPGESSARSRPETPSHEGLDIALFSNNICLTWHAVRGHTSNGVCLHTYVRAPRPAVSRSRPTRPDRLSAAPAPPAPTGCQPLPPHPPRLAVSRPRPANVRTYVRAPPRPPRPRPPRLAAGWRSPR